MNRGRALSTLSAIFQGKAPANAQWPNVIMLAGEQLVLAELYPRMSRAGCMDDLPPDVVQLTAEVTRRNRLRNAHLFETLEQALSALNTAGISPILLKGCATWVTRDGVTHRPDNDRMVSDLDLMVRPSEMTTAIIALERIGFEIIEDARSKARHPVVDLGRSTDVGAIDLHQQSPGPAGLPDVDNLHDHCRSVQIGAASALLPSPELQILVATLHDQLLDGAFWHGGFNLRHLLDIAKLAEDPIDWTRLATISRSPLVRSALTAQLHAASCIAGARVPDALSSAGRLHFLRQRLQFTRPAINAVFRSLKIDSKLWRPLSSRPIAQPG